MVNKELLDKFKRLYQEEFEITLTDEEATKMSADLINLVRVLVSHPQPDKSETYLGGKK